MSRSGRSRRRWEETRRENRGLLRRTWEGRWRRLRRRGSVRRRRGSEKQNWIGNLLVHDSWSDLCSLIRVALIQQQKIELASEIPDEPEASDPAAVRVFVKLPGGQVGDFLFIIPQSERSEWRRLSILFCIICVSFALVVSHAFRGLI